MNLFLTFLRSEKILLNSPSWGVIILFLSKIENNSFENISVFPNPFQDFLYLSKVKNLKNLKVYNFLGQLVIETKEIKIDFRNLKNGIYFLQIHTGKGTITKKIIKN